MTRLSAYYSVLLELLMHFLPPKRLLVLCVPMMRLSVNLCFSLHCSLVDICSPCALVLESSCYPLLLLLLVVVFKSLMFLHSTRLLGVTLLGFPRCIISSSVFSPFHLLLLRSFFHIFQTFMSEEVSEVVTSITGHG